MKRALIIGLLVALSTAGIAHAQAQVQAANIQGPSATQVLSQINATTPTVNADGTVTNSPAASTQSGTGAGAGAQSTPEGALGWILSGIMTIFSWLAGTAGVILNDTVYYTVVQMGAVVNPNNLSAIGVAWRILRDLGNIVLIFGFIAIGISTIIGYDSYGISKRLPTLLIVAIFINFSLFATEAIIDVGNLFATEFYTQLNGGQAPAATGLSPSAIASGGISGTIMNTLNLQNIYNVSGNSSISAGGISLVAVLGIILYIILAFVFFALAIMLIARFVALVFLMVVAPIGFAGLIVPGLEGLAKDWWKYLFNQVLVAPALLLMLYVAFAVITDAKFLTGFGANGGQYAAVANGSTSASALGSYAGILLAFIVAMGLLLACVVVAKKMGAVGSSAATKWAGKASFGAVSFVGRRTAGRYSNYLSTRLRSGEGFLGKTIGQTDLGRLAALGADYGAKASFDLRGAKAVQNLAKSQKIELGTPPKDGYQGLIKRSVDDRTKYAKSLEGTATVSKKQAQENYANSLGASSKLSQPATWLNAAGFGTAVGAAHGVPVGLAAGAVAGGLTGIGVGLAGVPVYLASAAPVANKKARDAILKDVNKNTAQKIAEAFSKIEENEGKEPERKEEKVADAEH